MGLRIRKLADKTSGERVTVPVMQELTLRNGETVLVPTGEVKLVNPDTPGTDHEPWPMVGVEILGDEPPARAKISQRMAQAASGEGWLTLVNSRPVVRPAGPNQGTFESSVNGTPHVFYHADEIHIETANHGLVKYRVVRQPDKYAATEGADLETPVTPEMYAAGQTSVDWTYGLELMDSE